MLARELPPRALLYSALNALSRITQGSRRFEFERLYAEHDDPWNYRSSAYERQKYERTRASALRTRRDSRSALEVGCSIGVFTDLIAPDFDQIVAVDLSREAMRAAANRTARHRHVRLLRGDFGLIDLSERFDVIFCAEVLYYVRRRDICTIAVQLDRFLAAHGVLVIVTGEANRAGSEYFNDWENLFGRRFEAISKESFVDEARPYSITVFARRRAPETRV